MAEVVIPGEARLSGRDLRPGASAAVEFTPQRGTVSVTPFAVAAGATPLGKPPDLGGAGRPGDDLARPGGTGTPRLGDDVVISQDAKIEVALFPPGHQLPQKSKTFTFRRVGQTVEPLELGVRDEQAGRPWRCRLRNVGGDEINASATIRFVRERRVEPDEELGVVTVGEEASLPATFLRPGDRTELAFLPKSGVIEFAMVGLEQGLPSPPGKTLPGEDGVDEPLPIRQDVRVRVELIGPGSQRPVVTTEFRSTRVPFEAEDVEPVLTHTVEEAEADRTWRVRLTNRGDTAVRCHGTARFVGERLRADLPLRVLNHGLRQVVAALGLRVRLDGKKAVIGVSEELETFLGEIIGSSLSVPIDFSGEIRDLNLFAFGVHARADGSRPVITAHARFETRGVEIKGFVRGVPVGDVDFSRLAVTVNIGLNTVGRPGRRELEPLIDVEVDAKAFARVLSLVGVSVTDRVVNEIKPKIEEFARSAAFRNAIREFAGETFVRLVAPGNRFEGLRAEPGRFVVLHLEPGPGDPDTRPTQPTHVEFPRPAGVEPQPLSDQDRANLAKIDHIVVLMQENRSFDQMLGYLSHPAHGLARLQADGRDVPDGLGGGESNPRSLGGQRVVSAAYDEEALIDGRRVPATGVPFNPSHSHQPVLRQIAGGRMSGFVDSFVDRYPNVDPAFVMRFYTDRHLPVFDRLASASTICDRWFCSHPGPTWPNRFCTLSGHTPELDNFDVGAPLLGFLRMGNVFDVLTEAGIDWVYYEGDIGFVRVYDQYRIEDRHVVPFDDPSDGFLRRADLGTLPPVTFIDPNFADIPPASTGNDDHAPADLRHGQQLVARIHDALTRSPRWTSQDGSGTLLVITYDEHGGFYDHVPPPGTEASGMAGVPPVHPDGPSHLGPRVPAFVISPFAEAGKVSSTVYDHTSPLATILHRFVGEIPREFGPRVAAANHLGSILGRDQARRPAALGAQVGTPLTERLVEIEPDPSDFHAGMRTLALPSRR